MSARTDLARAVELLADATDFAACGCNREHGCGNVAHAFLAEQADKPLLGRRAYWEGAPAPRVVNASRKRK